MPVSWSSSQIISFNFHQLAGTIFRKYPNEYAQHVVSVDVLDRSIDPETGVLRTERLIGVHQPAPRWVASLLGTNAESYAREVTFLVPESSDAPETQPPTIIVSSINMSLKNVLTCYERISYVPSRLKPKQETVMTTIAEISAHGKLRDGGMTARKVGRKFEDYSLERYKVNSQIGRKGLDSKLEQYFPDHLSDRPKEDADNE
ncbi:MSF1-domain-containing protein [Cystobasidium minutum MCA 4210]|uniref:MSF1-domain-containing protein n=1 Tax=Cystobasidium minutum MCA 4210 TaxID=1397322 RepID=UPI0034CF24A8|eukprot:jgi/Rhomi1/189401/estExt_fgenesh1_pg.C_3_t20405